MKLILAQGNPETRYDGTRHNIGFAIANSIADKHGITFVSKPKFFAEIAEFDYEGEKILLVKPTTYYNETGRSYRALVDFYKLAPEDVLIIHDELSLPLGTLRIREGGSDAGNNGIKSINAHGGTSTRRLRVGVGSELRDHIDDTDFVLGKFTKDEQEKLESLKPRIAQIVKDFLTDNFAVTTHQAA